MSKDISHKKQRLEDWYVDWLIDWVSGDTIKEERDDHRFLLYRLYETDFDETNAKLIPNDDNRIVDGLQMRHKYDLEMASDDLLDYMYIEKLLKRKPCSVLEMLIALAIRMEDSMELDLFPTWFWVMIDNLDLMGMDNDHYDEDFVDEKLDIFLNRKYATDGSGGLFPLKHPEKNQKRTEIWYQMSFYLTENYL